MNWLARARREILEKAESGTAETAKTSPENLERAGSPAAETVKTGVPSVLTVPHPAFFQESSNSPTCHRPSLPELERLLATQKEGLYRGRDRTWITYCLVTRKTTGRYGSLDVLASDLSVLDGYPKPKVH